MFKFGDGTGSGPRSGGAPPGMGGGNWLSNAQSMGDLTLAHALASALPSGYNRQRPHAFVLTLSGRSSYFFQAGTGDLVAEWVSTCNYWAARLSKEPYTGGVSNMEYGWNRVRLDDDDRPLPPAADDRDDRGSIRSGFSGHSTFSRRNKLGFQHSLGQAGAAPSSNPHDRIFVADWKTPQLPATASSLGEQGQLDSLKRTASNMQGELERHNKLRKPMLALVRGVLNPTIRCAPLTRPACAVHAPIAKLHQGLSQLGTQVAIPSRRVGQILDLHRRARGGHTPSRQTTRREACQSASIRG